MDSKRALVDPSNGSISISRQCELLGLPRSSYYARPKPRGPEGFTDEEERAMRIIDEEHAVNLNLPRFR